MNDRRLYRQSPFREIVFSDRLRFRSILPLHGEDSEDIHKMKQTTILSEKQLFIFDMDGTIYLGENVFGCAVNFIRRLRKNGKRILFFTNNASHVHEFYLKKLGRMGFEPQPDEIMTSGDVTAEFLRRERCGKKVYLVGTDELRREFVENGIRLSDGTDGSADIVVTSFDTSLDYRKLERACTYVRGGAEYFSTHPDLNCPTENGFIPDSGAVSAFVTAATGAVPVYLGKPYKPTIDMISAKSGTDLSRMCIFGDRLYTDIAMGKNYGVTACLVLSGETSVRDVNSAAPESRPDFVFQDLGDAEKQIFG